MVHFEGASTRFARPEEGLWIYVMVTQSLSAVARKELGEGTSSSVLSPRILAGNPRRIDRLYGNRNSEVFCTAIPAQSDFLFRCYPAPLPHTAVSRMA